MVNDIDGFTAAGFTFHGRDAAGEYPRMATAGISPRPLANTKQVKGNPSWGYLYNGNVGTENGA